MSIQPLTEFDKLNLAICAVRRANEVYLDNRRFNDEYATAMLWKRHRLSQAILPGSGLYCYATSA